MNPVKLLESMDLEQLLQAAEDDIIEDMLYDAMRKMEQETPSDKNYFLPMKLMDEYHNSQEYRQLSENVKDYKEHMLKTGQLYLGKKEKLEQAALEQLDSRTYGKGGPCHRGPLYPGNMEIICASGRRKGRLFRQSKSPDYIYGLDKNGKLLFCKNKADRTTEYIITEKNKELGIAYGQDGKIAAISELYYDAGGQLSDYKYAGFWYGKRNLKISLCCEIYHYQDREVYIDLIQAEGKYPSCEHFRFLQDDDGFVIKGECCNVMHKLIMDVEIPRGMKLRGYPPLK